MSAQSTLTTQYKLTGYTKHMLPYVVGPIDIH